MHSKWRLHIWHRIYRQPVFALLYNRKSGCCLPTCKRSCNVPRFPDNRQSDGTGILPNSWNSDLPINSIKLRWGALWSSSFCFLLFPSSILRMTSKGQTALEYLLILVVTLTVVIGVMVWLQATGRSTTIEAGASVDRISCKLNSCENDSDCPVKFCGDVSCSALACVAGEPCAMCDAGVCSVGECSV